MHLDIFGLKKDLKNETLGSSLDIGKTDLFVMKIVFKNIIRSVYLYLTLRAIRAPTRYISVSSFGLMF